MPAYSALSTISKLRLTIGMFPCPWHDAISRIGLNYLSGRANRSRGAKSCATAIGLFAYITSDRAAEGNACCKGSVHLVLPWLMLNQIQHSPCQITTWPKGLSRRLLAQSAHRAGRLAPAIVTGPPVPEP